MALHRDETRRDNTTRCECGAVHVRSIEAHMSVVCIGAVSFICHRHFCTCDWQWCSCTTLFVHTLTRANTSNWLPMELRAYDYLTSTFNHCCEWCVPVCCCRCCCCNFAVYFSQLSKANDLRRRQRQSSGGNWLIILILLCVDWLDTKKW